MEKKILQICLDEKLAIVVFKDSKNLLNKRLDIMTKYKHERKF